jgi:copper chaperone CopZ
MTCTGRANNIRFVLTSLEGVRQVNPDHRAKRVEVDYDPGLIIVGETRPAAEDIEYQGVAS